MNEEQIQNEIDNVVDDSPVTTVARTKRKITYTRVPMNDVVAESEPLIGTTPNPDEGAMVNTTRPAPREQATQHINDNYPDAVKLTTSGGDAYIGGSVSPNSTVRAKIRPMNEYARDPFWLESTDRFAPVGDWTVNMPILNEPVKVSTYDIDKAAAQIAIQYQGVPEQDFFGYEYTPLEDYHEGAWSAFWNDMERGMAGFYADTPSAAKGLVSDTEAAKLPEQREEESRTSSGALNFLRKRSQYYLDYINELEPMPRTRLGEVTSVAGSGVVSFLPVLASIPGGPAAWALGAAGSTAMSISETLSTRDAVLQSGGTVDEAQAAQWKHLGAIGATEAISSMTGQYLARGIVRAAINRGATRSLSKVAGGVAQVGVAGPIDATTEVLQDRYGSIAAGRSGYESLYGWSREDWNTFYGTLLLGALGGAGGVIEGSQEFDRTAKVSDDYLALAAKLKQTLVESAAKNGVTVTPEVMGRLDDLAMEIWRNPEAIIDNDMRSVAQGFYDKLSNIDPAVIEQAQKLVAEDPNKAQQLTEKAFTEFDNNIKAQPWWGDLSEIEQQAILGEMRGMAYVGAFFFNQSPSEIIIPSFSRDTISDAAGDFANPRGLETVLKEAQEKYSFAESRLDTALTNIIKMNREYFLQDNMQEALSVLEDYLKKISTISSMDEFFYPDAMDGVDKDAANEARRFIQSTPLVSELFNEFLDASIALNVSKQQQSPAGRVRAQKQSEYKTTDKQNYISAKKNYDSTYSNPRLANLNTLLHEFSHANDWRLDSQTVNDLVEFASWYTKAISEVFGEQRGIAVAGKMLSNESSRFAFKVDSSVAWNKNFYKSTDNITENRAQAIGRLLEKAKDYIGLTGKPAQFIQAVNALLQGMDDVTPLPDGLSDYVAAMKDYVRKNSAVINRIKDKVPAERMNAAIKSYMGGNDNINWQGVTPKTLAEFAEAATTPLDSEALAYATKALGDTDIHDFVDRALGDWDAAWSKEGVGGDKPLSDTEKVNNVRLNDIDGGMNPEVTEDALEDWEYEQSSVQSALGEGTVEDLIEAINEASGKEPSAFRKKVSQKFNGMDVEESMRAFLNTMKEHDYVKTGTFLDFVRGTPAFLNALGGEKLVKQFDLVGRYDDFANKAAKFNESLVQKLIPMFGSRRAYEDYVRRAGVRKYEIEYLNPATKEKEKRMVSKRELMSAVLYNEQPDSKERVAMTVDDAEVRKLLDDTDIEFARTLRNVLATDYRRFKSVKGKGKIPVNYFPIMDSYSQEKGADNIINDFGRKKTDEPIGLVDVMNVIGAYMSRVAGTESGYFAGMRRLNTILNYNARNAVTGEMSPDDVRLNEELDKISTNIGQEIRARMGASDFERFRDGVRDVVEHRNDDELKDSLASKIARNSLTKLIYGKTKQFAINVGNMFSFLGYEHNTYQSYLFGLVKALANPVRSWRLAMENETLRNRRNLYRYNEYMEKNLSANSDSLLTYLADWATRKDIKSLEALTDFVIHVGTWTRRVLAEPLREGDFLGNAIGYAASYNAAVKALGSEEAARRSLAEFVNTRQSTSNQAVKGLMVRKANREGFWGNIFAFTGEPTQKWGTVAQDVNRMMSGDLSVEKGTRDIVAQTMTQLAYVAVQGGIVMGALIPFMGGKMTDDDWDRIYNNVYKELVGVLSGIGGPLTNAIVQPTMNQIVFDYDVNGISLPGLAWIATETDALKKGAFDKAIYNALDVAGVTSGITNFMSEANGLARYIEAKNKKEANAGLWIMEGRSEGMANRLAGVKKKKKKK